MQPQGLTVKLEETQKYIYILIFSHGERNKANASRDTRLGHASHAQDDVSRPVLRTMGKRLESKTTMTEGNNDLVIEQNTIRGGQVQGLRQKFRGW